jgi:hypothetical protein
MGGPPPTGTAGPGHDGGPAGGGGVLVAADGTACIVSEVSTGTNTYAQQIEAITTSGNVAWKVTLDSGHGRLELAGSNLIAVSHTEATSTTAASSTITAYSTATGAKAWSLTLAGNVGDIHPFSGGIYAVQVIPPATTGGTATRNLVAISNSGAVLWKVSV